MLAGRISPWRVAAWVENLPLDSALARVSGHGWSVSDYLLAAVLDETRTATWQRANAGSKSPSARPKPVWRPGDKVAPAITVADLRAFRERHRERNAGR